MSDDIPTDDTPLDHLPLTVRAANCLKNMFELQTVGQVRRTTDQQLLRCPNLGRTTLMHIREVTGSPIVQEPKSGVLYEIRDLLAKILKEIENANRFR